MFSAMVQFVNSVTSKLPAGMRSRFEKAFHFSQAQVAHTVARTPDYFPIYTVDGQWHHAGELWTDWTGGFFVGMMWKFYAHNRDPLWRERAERYSQLLTHRQYDQNVHDLGFIFLNTYRPWYELTGESHLRDVLVQAGRTLAGRYMERGKYLRSFVGARKPVHRHHDECAADHLCGANGRR